MALIALLFPFLSSWLNSASPFICLVEPAGSIISSGALVSSGFSSTSREMACVIETLSFGLLVIVRFSVNLLSSCSRECHKFMASFCFGVRFSSGFSESAFDWAALRYSFAYTSARPSFDRSVDISYISRADSTGFLRRTTSSKFIDSIRFIKIASISDVDGGSGGSVLEKSKSISISAKESAGLSLARVSPLISQGFFEISFCSISWICFVFGSISRFSLKSLFNSFSSTSEVGGASPYRSL